MNTTKNYKKNIKNKSDATINKQTKLSIGSGARDKDKAPQGWDCRCKEQEKNSKMGERVRKCPQDKSPPRQERVIQLVMSLGVSLGSHSSRMEGPKNWIQRLTLDEVPQASTASTQARYRQQILIKIEGNDKLQN